MTEVKKKTSGIAVASLVCGCLFLVPVLGVVCSLAALILGIIALVKLSKAKDEMKGKGLAIAGTVLGSIGLIVFIAFMIMVATVVPQIAENPDGFACQVAGFAIQAGLAAYSAEKSTDGEAVYPASLHDPDFLEYSSDGEVLEHPFDRNWDDYYDPSTGQLNVEDACKVEE